MHSGQPHGVATGWSLDAGKSYMVLLFILVQVFLRDAVQAVGHGNSGNSQGCQFLNPSQLERKLRDEGDFDHRYMAADLEDAVDKFPDLADAKFIRRAEVYTCDAQCIARTDQIRTTFAKYGQIPTQSDPGPSFADVRQLLEGHVGAPAPASQWSGPIIPTFGGFVKPPQQTADNKPAPGVGPGPAPAPAPAPGPAPVPGSSSQSGIPSSPLDPGFLTGPQGPGTDENGAKTPRPKGRRTKSPPQGVGTKWLTPGDLVNDPPLNEFPSSGDGTIIQISRKHTIRRHPRSTPVNSTSIGQSLKIRCSKSGEEEQSGLHLLCGSCRVIRELPADYFPRYINEVACAGQTCFDKASTEGGRCVEQLVNFDILRNVGTSECQKWTTYTIAVPVCCSCLMSSSLAQYLTMPWSGQSAGTSGPSRT